MSKLADLKFGFAKEKEIMPELEAYFETKLEETSKRHLFDFKSDKIIIELKSRRVNKNKYMSTMVGINKIEEGHKYLEKGFEVYFAFKFKDALSYYELTKDTPRKWTRDGGRCDRGRKEIKKYCFIPTSKLIDIWYNEKYNDETIIEDFSEFCIK